MIDTPLPHSSMRGQTIPTARCFAAGRWLSGLTFGIALLALVLCLAPRTALTALLESFLDWVMTVPCLASPAGPFVSHDFMHKIGSALLLGLLLVYAYRRASKYFEGDAAGLLDAVAAFAVLYLCGPLWTASYLLPLENRWWPLFVFALCLGLMLWGDERQALRLAQWTALLIALQAFYAVVYYALDIGQFHTSHFGRRTSGTFFNPGTLYPLCLLGVPLCWCLSNTSNSSDGRWFWRFAGALILGALVLTFMRGGWIALAMALLYLALASRSSLHQSTLWRRSLVVLSLLLLVGAATWRTRGAVIGNSRDRSTLGRAAIWRVAGRVWMQHPWLGGGIGSYGINQRRHMTPQLESFNPMNRDPKSLTLQVAVEFGVLGLAALGFFAWRYVLFYRVAARLPLKSQSRAVLCGVHCGLIALAVAGLVDTPILDLDRVPATLALGVLLAVTCVLARQAPANLCATMPARLPDSRESMAVCEGA